MNEILSPLYKIIIFLEEKGEVKSSSIDMIDKKSLRGVVGKMEAMKLIKRNGDKICLSENGFSYLNSVLDAIHKPTMHWDGKWRIVYFTTPENIRKRRDKFRRVIEQIGFRPLIKGLWFSPTVDCGLIKKIISENDMNGMAVVLESQDVYGISPENIAESWQFSAHRIKYEEFIKLSENFFSSSTKDNFIAKQLMFKFALLLNSELQLPIELLPKDWPKYRAKLMYKKLKNAVLG